MKTPKVLVAILVFLLADGCGREPDSGKAWQDKFQGAVQQADRIVVRDGGFDCCGPVDNEDILFEVTDASEIEEVLQHFTFMTQQKIVRCWCCGFPGIDWYRGRERLALTALQHGTRLRWKGLRGDAQLTTDAEQWVVEWLGKHGVSAKDIEGGCGGPRRDAKRLKAEQKQSP